MLRRDLSDDATAVFDASSRPSWTTAIALLTDLQALRDDLRTAIDQLLVADVGASDGAAQALSYHYLARIAAHLSTSSRRS